MGLLILWLAKNIAMEEAKTSILQAKYISAYGKDLTYQVEPQPAADVPYPNTGPYNERLGYTGLPNYIRRITADGFSILKQAHLSEALTTFIHRGGFAPYATKTQAGLILKDRAGNILYNALYPERVYDTFESVPPLVIHTLLFVENRELLDPDTPYRNPAVEWDRFIGAVLNLPLQWTHLKSRSAGGSTLATQIEKYRHSPHGRTDSGVEKLRQMASASVRAYLNGRKTLPHRQQIVVDYLNSTPLTARGLFGEVNGLGDGLWAWFGTDFKKANRLLRRTPATARGLAQQAYVYKQVLALMLAQRRPSHYLVNDRAGLEQLTNSHLRVLADAGVISIPLRDAALALPLTFAKKDPVPDPVSFVDQKAPNSIRYHLLDLLGVNKLYSLDRLDLNVDTTLDLATQEKVIHILRQLNTPAFLEKNGLVGERLLNDSDPRRIVYSFTLMEKRPSANFVRVQADNLDQPLDVNEKIKLDLGSTAKLRTLATYLDIITTLHRRHASQARQILLDQVDDGTDPLTRWALEYLAATPNRNLQPMLEAAMARTYSASTGETFFTGSGQHTFVNFDPLDNSKTPTVQEALRHSINLPFIRLMRDIVRFYRSENMQESGDILTDKDNPVRQEYLQRFADKEGGVYLSSFYKKYQGKTPDQALRTLVQHMRPRAERLAVVYRSVRPEASLADFSAFVRFTVAGESVTDAQLKKLYDKHAPGKFNLADRGYLARIHPLELWLVHYLHTAPSSSREDVLKASTDQRQESYTWLFKTRRTATQNTRIRILLEQEAFVRIHQHWATLGYPFSTLVPSYATAIGSSADKPDALAELMGIILNDGVRLPTVRIRQLHFAEGTPYEVMLRRRMATPNQVMDPAVAATLCQALLDVVAQGTAQRANDAFKDPSGNIIPVAGKTGTGDQRFEKFGAKGQLISSRVVNRTATFVFAIGDRFFGIVTAHVQGSRAAEYRFTSALPAQLLKVLSPALSPLIQGVPSEHSIQQEIATHDPAP